MPVRSLAHSKQYLFIYSFIDTHRYIYTCICKTLKVVSVTEEKRLSYDQCY